MKDEEKKKRALRKMSGRANRIRESGGFAKGDYKKPEEGSGWLDKIRDAIGSGSFADKFDKNRRKNPKFKKKKKGY